MFSNSSKTGALYYLGDHNGELVEKCKPHLKTIQEFLDGKRTNAMNAEKLKDHNIFSIRLNKKGRLLFTYLNGAFVILDVLENHEYGKSKWLKKNVLKRFLENNQPAIEKNIEEKDFVSCTIPQQATQNFSQQSSDEWVPLYYFQDTYMVLSEEQKQILQAFYTKKPLLIQGPPGSGKTSIALLLLEQQAAGTQNALESAKEDQKKPMLYVAQSSKLVEQMRLSWEASPYYTKDAAKIMTHQEFFSEITQNQSENYKELSLLDAKSTTADLAKWFAQYLEKANIKKDVFWKNKRGSADKFLPLLRQEFRIIALWSEAYASEIFGKKQSHFEDSKDKAALHTAFLEWMSYLKNNQLISSEFSKIVPEQKFSRIIVDEAQDLSDMQLASLFHAAEEGQIVYCADSRQNVTESLPKSTRLKKFIYEEKFELKELTLSVNYRCPAVVMSLATWLNEQRLTINSTMKSEAKMTTSGIPGHIIWPVEQTEAELLKKTKENISDSPNTCVITWEHFFEAAKTLDITQIFTPSDAKGLQFDHVILYNLFDHNLLYGSTYLDLAKNDSNRGNALSVVFSQLFVATTRCKKTLYIIQSQKHELETFTDGIQNALKESYSADFLNLSSADMNSPEQVQALWLQQAKHLIDTAENTQNTQTAINILVTHCKYEKKDAKTEVEKWMRALKPQLEENTQSSEPETTVITPEKTGPEKRKKKPKTLQEQSTSNDCLGLTPVKTIDQKPQYTERQIALANSFHENLNQLEATSLQNLVDELGPGINIPNDDGNTFLYLSIEKNLPDEIFKIFLSSSFIDVNAKNWHGDTALLLAVRQYKWNIVKILIEKGADVNAKNKYGKTARDFTTVQKENSALNPENQQQNSNPPLLKVYTTKNDDSNNTLNNNDPDTKNSHKKGIGP